MEDTAKMNETNNYQADLFGSDPKGKKKRGPGILDQYTKQLFLPYIYIPIEYTVIIGVVVLLLVVLSYAIGVERGKRIIPAEERVSISLEEMGLVTVEGMFDIKRPQEGAGAAAAGTGSGAVAGEELAGEMGAGQRGAVAGIAAEASVSGTAGSAYVVQLASSKNEKYAKDEVEKLKKSGVSANFKKSGTWYQVYAEGYGTMEEARKAEKTLKQKYPSCFIRKSK